MGKSSNMRKIKIILFSTSIVLFLFSCKKSSVSSNNYPTLLTGTKWCIYQYKDATTSTPQLRNDTLIFTEASTYKFNNQTYTYRLTLGDYTHLTLGQTPFGDIDGTVPNNFISNGEIVNVPFSQLKAGGALTYFLWMKKL